MELERFEVALSLGEVVAAIGSIQERFIKTQLVEDRPKFYIRNSALQVQHTLSKIPDIEGIPAAKLQPTEGMLSLNFYCYVHNEKEAKAWEITVREAGEYSTILDISSQNNSIQHQYITFLGFVREWAKEHAVDKPADSESDNKLLCELAIRPIDRSGDWLTKSYILSERIAIVELWRLWRDKRGPSWTRIQHAQHFHIPDGTLGDWITKLDGA